MSDFSRDELTEAVAAGIEMALVKFGFHHDDASEIRDDLKFVRKTRQRCETIEAKFLAGVVAAFTVFVMSAMSVGVAKLWGWL